MTTETTNPYTAIIPAMTTGIMERMIKSGRNVPIIAMPTPDFVVPYAAPNAKG
jgi:hypothetical protein